MAWGYFSTRNKAATARTITIAGADASCDPDWLVDGELLTVVRGAAADQPLVIKWDFGEVDSIRGWFFGQINWPEGTTVRVCMSNVSVDGEEIKDTLYTPMQQGGRKQVMLNMDASLSARYGRVEIDTGSSSSVRLEVGWFWIGDADFEPVLPAELPGKLTFVSRTLLQLSEGSVDFTDKRRGFYQWAFGFRLLSEAEAMGQALAIDAELDLNKPFLFVPHRRNNNNYLNLQTLLGKFGTIDTIDEIALLKFSRAYLLRETLSAEQIVTASVGLVDFLLDENGDLLLDEDGSPLTEG